MFDKRSRYSFGIFGVGLFGLGLMFFSPFYGILEVIWLFTGKTEILQGVLRVLVSILGLYLGICMGEVFIRLSKEKKIS